MGHLGCTMLYRPFGTRLPEIKLTSEKWLKLTLGGAWWSEGHHRKLRNAKDQEDRGNSRMAVAEEESQSCESSNGHYLDLEYMIVAQG